MSVNVAFLTRLSRIAGEPACAEARAARATALVHAYVTVLYVRLGITGSQRPTACAKETAKEFLEALRRELLKGEIDAPPASVAMFASARERIDMARRALSLRVTVEDDRARVAIGQDDDRQRLDALRASLRNRRAVAASLDAIKRSLDLLNAS